MKIVHIIDNLNAGGAQTFVVQLSVEQSKGGHKVVVLVVDRLLGSDFENSLIQKLKQFNIRVITSSRRRGRNLTIISSLINIWKVFRSQRPDVINSHLRFSHLLTSLVLMFLASVKSKRHIITLHNAPEVWSKANMLLNNHTASIFCSQASLETCQHRDCDKVVIENGIHAPDITKNAETILKRNGVENENKIVLCVGKLSPQKNYQLMVQVAELYLDQPVSFVVSGLRGDTAQQDEEAFKKLPNIHYIGTCLPAEIHSLMHYCDCFLNTSKFEGLPITVLEAFFLGTPCVLSPVRAHFEIGNVMPYCSIVSEFDAGQFKKEIDNMLVQSVSKDHVLAQRQSFLKKFEIETTAKRYISFYEKALSGLN